MKKMLKYTFAIVLGLSATAFLYLNQLFGKKLPADVVTQYKHVSDDSLLKVRFFGTMCYYVEYKGNAVLADPFFSNPNPIKMVVAGKPNPEYRKLFSEQELQSIRAITVGHAHYDHCLELPIFLSDANTTKKIIGSQSMINLFYKTYPDNDYVNAEDFLSGNSWIYTADSSIRIYPVKSVHAPHFGNVTLMSGENKAFDKVPADLLKWQMGQPLSYLIDFMEADTIARRVYMNGGISAFPNTAFERAMLEEHPVNMAFTIHWNQKYLPAKIEEIKKVQPQSIILGHWNNFFNTRKGDDQYIRKSRLPESLEEVTALYPQYHIGIMLPETLK